MMERFDYSIATMRPTRQQKLFAGAVAAVLLVGFLATAPFAATRVVRLDSFVPTLGAIIFVTDLTTSVLLFSQYASIGSRGLLVLANGYLFSALVVIPHSLSFPGAFAENGLLVFGPQTTPWLYTFWHLGFSAAVLVYACIKKRTENNGRADTPSKSPIFWNVTGTLLLAATLTVIAIVEEESLPRLVLNQVAFSPLASHVTAVTLITSVIALVVLWIRQELILDLWLLVSVLATVAEQGVVSILIAGRFSVGFYSSRVFSVAVSTVVMMALLSEMAAVYARLARANRTLQRERDGKLMNLEAALAAIAHEVRQPLTGISTKSAAARRFLSRAPPDIPRVQAILDEVTSAGFRTNEVIESVRALFQINDQEQSPVDVNAVTLEALQILRKDFEDHDINITTRLALELPPIMGHKGQLREVIVNLAQNSIDAMVAVVDGNRQLRIETTRNGARAITISVEDTGPGIDPKNYSRIFDAFVTTKSKGTGLGLAISQMIVDRHGGQIVVMPGSGNGARFQVTLPVQLAVVSSQAAE